MNINAIAVRTEEPVCHQQTVSEAMDAWRNEGNPN